MEKPLIKICGLTDVREVEYLKENKVDFAGMVLFFPKSKRNITVDKACEIIEALHEGESVDTKDTGIDFGAENFHTIKSVAVVVAPTLSQIFEIEAAGFDYVQIHGEITEEILIGCRLPILKAFNVDDLDNYDYYLSFPNIAGFVFDAGEPGSGKTFDWNMLKSLSRKPDKLYLLAGGINSKNVARAITTVDVDGVDVSSGVEYDDKLGKDPEKITELVVAVRKYE